jgi:cobalt-zinc-cadmium efflux system outer membrane protein
MSRTRRIGAFLLLGAAAACVTRDPRLEAEHVRSQIERPSAFASAESGPAAPPVVPDGVRLEDGVSQDEAVWLALWNNADFAEQLAAMGLSRADLARAGSLANPALSVLVPVGPKQLEYALALPLEALWIRPLRVATARLEGERAAERLVQAGHDLVRDVRAATASAAGSRERAEIAMAVSDASDQIAEIAQRRLAIGDASENDALQARLESVRALEDLRLARADSDAAQRRWEALLGLGAPARELAPAPGEPAARCAEDAELGELRSRARGTRPALRAAQLGTLAAARRASLARAEIFAGSLIFDANGAGRDHQAGPGISLVLPILDQNQAGRLRARAEAGLARATERATAERIDLEVRDAHARAREAAERWHTWRGSVVAPLAESFSQAERRIASGEAPELALLEARRDLDRARLREVELRTARAIACAELERSAASPVPAPATEGSNAAGPAPGA